MKKLLFPAFCAMLLMGALSSCKYFPVDPIDPIDPIDPPGPRLVNTAWKLDAYSFVNMKVRAVPVEGTFTLHFNSEKEAGGTADCNSYGAEYKADHKNISFGNIITTYAYCGDESFNFYGALGTASSYEITDNSLRIVYDNGTKILHFSPMTVEPVTNYIKMIETFSTIDFHIDPFHMQGIKKIDDTHISITVAYSGGCVENHDFFLFGSEEFKIGQNNDTDEAEIILAHNAYGDLCNAMITKTIVFDVTPLLDAHRRSGSTNKLLLKFSQFPNAEPIIF